MIAYLHVVAEVYTVHQVVFIADAGAAAFIRSAADHYIFANVIVVADNQLALITFVMEVLRFGAQHGAVMHSVSFSHAGTFKDLGTGHDYAIVTDFHTPFDISERLDCYILTDFCGRIYIS